MVAYSDEAHAGDSASSLQTAAVIVAGPYWGLSQERSILIEEFVSRGYDSLMKDLEALASRTKSASMLPYGSSFQKDYLVAHLAPVDAPALLKESFIDALSGITVFFSLNIGENAKALISTKLSSMLATAEFLLMSPEATVKWRFLCTTLLADQNWLATYEFEESHFSWRYTHDAIIAMGVDQDRIDKALGYTATLYASLDVLPFPIQIKDRLIAVWRMP